MDAKQISGVIVSIAIVGILIAFLMPTALNGLADFQTDANSYSVVTEHTYTYTNKSIEYNDTYGADYYLYENWTDNNETRYGIYVSFDNYTDNNCTAWVTWNSTGETYTTVTNNSMSIGDTYYFNQSNAGDNGYVNMTLTVNNMTYDVGTNQHSVYFDTTQTIGTDRVYSESILNILPIISILLVVGLLLVVIVYAIKVV